MFQLLIPHENGQIVIWATTRNELIRRAQAIARNDSTVQMDAAIEINEFEPDDLADWLNEHLDRLPADLS